MLERIALVPCLAAPRRLRPRRQFRRVALAMLALAGRVARRGTARWTGVGGRTRAVQRVFATTLPRASLFWRFFRTHRMQRSAGYLLGRAATVETNVGRPTQGRARWRTSRGGKPVPGRACFARSRRSIPQRRSFPSPIAQVVRTAEERAAPRAKQRVQAVADPACTRTPGRSKGSTTTARAALLVGLGRPPPASADSLAA